MSTIIDQSEKLRILTLAPLETVIIEHDKGTPSGEPQVRVSTKGIALGLGSTLLIQHHAELILDGAVSADILGTMDIGNNGTLFLNSSVGVGLLSTIKFTNTNGHGYLLINTSKVDLSGNISGFGERDTILLGQLGAVSASWTQSALTSGTLALYNAGGTEVDQIGLNGEYTTANFAIKDAQKPNGTDTTRITFVPQDTFVSPGANGFTLPKQDTDASHAAPGAGTLKELQTAAAMPVQLGVFNHQHG